MRKDKSAEELLRKESGFIRNLPPVEASLVSGIAILWALFQLSLPSFLIIDSTKERAIHLAFARVLLLLVYPSVKKPRKLWCLLSRGDRITQID
jgi:TRAP-type uncharacterized transport system fused permease subunit